MDIGAGSGVCTIVSNGLSSGGMLMIINPNTDILKVYDGTALTPTTPANARIGFQLRGYGFIIAPDTNTVFASNGSDFTDWPTLAQGTFISGQDRILAAIEDNGIAWLIGSATSQPVAFTGASPFPLAPIIGGTVSVGTCGPFTPAIAGGGVCMVSGSRRGFGQVIRLTPGRYERISNYAVEQSLATVSDWGSVIGSGYNSQGHDFYVLDIGTLQWVYDFTEKAWHQRRGWALRWRGWSSSAWRCGRRWRARRRLPLPPPGSATWRAASARARTLTLAQ
jgi:hypothetical protein